MNRYLVLSSILIFTGCACRTGYVKLDGSCVSQEINDFFMCTKTRGYKKDFVKSLGLSGNVSTGELFNMSGGLTLKNSISEKIDPNQNEEKIIAFCEDIINKKYFGGTTKNAASPESPCPTIAGNYLRSEDHLTMNLRQNGCEIQADQPNKDFEHKMNGHWDLVKKHFGYTVERKKRDGSCTSVLTGRMKVVSPDSLQTQIYATDGLCIDQKYSETSFWVRQ